MNENGFAQESTYLGIEFGSTRVKATLIGQDAKVLAQGSYQWENQFIDGYWTYDLEEVQQALTSTYTQIAQEVKSKFGVKITKLGGLGVSGMMHGYLAFDSQDNLLVPFRTWRNTGTTKAAQELSELFKFNIPLRWSIAHLYQAMLNKEPHITEVAYLTTLSGWAHWKLTGEKVLGAGDASGMFPLNENADGYDTGNLKQFEELAQTHGYDLKLTKLLPKVRVCGQDCGSLSPQGAKMLDPTGTLLPGIPMAAPEGDAGTGMVATKAVAPGTGNVSAGTSVFAMLVLEKTLKKMHTEIDIVATPAGKPVAMVHTNNCASDLDAWVSVFAQAAELLGAKFDTETLYSALLTQGMKSNPKVNGMLAYNYLSGEHIPNLKAGRPIIARTQDAEFTVASLFRTIMYSSFATLAMGMRVLKEENVTIKSMFAHGGVFKTPQTMQKILAAALESPVSVPTNAGEGGSWGMALLAQFRAKQKEQTEILSLEDFLEKVFAKQEFITVKPTPEETAGYQEFLERWIKGLEIERNAIKNM